MKESSPLSLTPQQIKAELINAGAAPDVNALQLDTIRRNPERRDYLSRETFRVHNGKNCYYLTVGPRLEELWKRSSAFAAACPDIASQPLFFHRAGNLDYLGMEFVGGTTLEDRIFQENLSATETLRIMERVVGSLERSFTPSTVEAAIEELEALFEHICASAVFGGLDQRFLRELIFPFIRTQASRFPPRKRWTNGDFIAKNIVIDAAGNPHLIDYEFARETHFYGEDAWRWRKIADIPPTHRALPDTPTSKQSGRWLDALFLLNQITLSHEINGAAAAIASSATAIDDLLRLVSETHSQFRSSLFYSSLGRPVSGPPDYKRSVNCQLFWSTDGMYNEESSQRLTIPTDTDVTVHFKFPNLRTPTRLRFDPADAPGLVKIGGLRIRAPQTDEPILRISGQTGWHSLELSSGAHRLADSPELNLLSLNVDPILLLPIIASKPPSDELLCEVDIRFTRDLEALPALLQSAPLSTKDCENRLVNQPNEPAISQPASPEQAQQLEQELAASRLQLDSERDDNAALRQAYGESVKRSEQYRLDHQGLVEAIRRAEASQAEATRRIGQLSSNIQEAEKARAYYEDKCNRINKSFSWRSTAVLRLLRRWLIDPRAR